MARTMNPNQPPQGGTTFHAGPPKPHLVAVRQTALRVAERRWTQVAIPRPAVVPLEFPSPVEWSHTTRLSFDATGFNFLGDPEPNESTVLVADVVISVKSALDEVERVPPRPSIRFEPIVWDELRDAVLEEEPLPVVGRTLELFQPPAPLQVVKEPPPLPVVIETQKVEEPEEPFDPPPMCEAKAISKPSLRPGPAPVEPAPAFPLAAGGSRIHLPVISIAPLRRPLVEGPIPESQVVAIEAPPVEETKPAETPPADTEPVEAEPAAGRNQIEAEILPAEPQADPAPAGAEIASPEEPQEPVQQESPEPAATPQNTLHFGGMADVAVVRKSKVIGLGLSNSESELIAPVAGIGMGLKIGIAAGILAVAGGIGMLVYRGSPQPAKTPAGGVASQVQTAGLVAGDARWSTDYVTDEQGQRLRQLSFYRTAMQVNDYRVEFEAEIEYKAVSWVVRAPDIKSHYVLKLVRDRGAKGPIIKLQRFPVLDGKPAEMVEKEAAVTANPGAVYRIQTDVVGDKFRVAVNEKTVDHWTDSRLAAGGFGVANEGIERGQIRAIQMWHLNERRLK